MKTRLPPSTGGGRDGLPLRPAYERLATRGGRSHAGSVPFLIQRGRDFDPARGALGAFLFGVARNYVRRAMEKSYTESVMTTPAEDDDPSLVTEFDPLFDLARSQTSKAVWKAVLSLPEHYREVVVLCDLQELSYADAAAALGRALGTIRSRLHRAHEMLVRKLQSSAPALVGFSGDAARCVS